MPEASAAPLAEQKLAKGRAWLRNGWGWAALASVIAGSVFGAVHLLEPRGGATSRAEETPQTQISIEVVARESDDKRGERNESPPAGAPTACMMVAAVPCAACEFVIEWECCGW